MLSLLQKKLHLTSKKLLFFQNSPVVMSELDWIRTSTEVENTKSISFIPPLMRQCKTEQILGVYPFSNTVILCQDLDETSKSKVILFISLSVYNVTNTISSEEKKKRRANTKVCG